MKRILVLLLLITFSLNLTGIQSYALSAQSAIVMDAASGRILFASNADQRMGMASTTKIATAITALENARLDSIVTVSPNASGVEGSSMYLEVGEKLTLEDVLWGLMLVSGNDAATAVAEHVSGSVEGFAALMNKTALNAGTKNTNFTNPHGLTDKDHYTTARDLAKITAYALKNPDFCRIVSSQSHSVPWESHGYDRYLVNHNKFLRMYDGCIGVKTGFTKATGRCLVTAVEKNGLRLICVTLNAPDDWNDHKIMYDNAFDTYSPFKIAAQGEIMGSGKLKNGNIDSLRLTVEDDCYIPLKPDEQSLVTIKAVPFEELTAPIKKGDAAGTLYVNAGDSFQGEFPLIAAEDAELKPIVFSAPKSGFLKNLGKVFSLWINCFN